jgi:hypothetical protein
MDGVQQFWTWAYLLGFGAFVVMAIIIIPLGLRDLLRLLKDLGSNDHGEDEDDAIPKTD